MKGIQSRAGLFKLVGACAAAAFLCGCAAFGTSRGLGLTGGSVPVGVSKMAVIVVRADDPNIQVDGIEASLVPASPTASRAAGASAGQPGPNPDDGGGAGQPGSGQVILPTPGTDATGALREYVFENIPAGFYFLKVRAPESAGVDMRYAWFMEVPGNTMSRVVASLWPATFDPDRVGSIEIAPQQITVSPGETARFIGAAADTAGDRIPLQASFMLQGDDTGEVRPNGTFLAQRLGKSRMVVWLAGKSAAAQVSVVP